MKKLRLPRKIKKAWLKIWIQTGAIDLTKKRFSRKFLHYAYKLMATKEPLAPLHSNRFFEPHKPWFPIGEYGFVISDKYTNVMGLL